MCKILYTCMLIYECYDTFVQPEVNLIKWKHNFWYRIKLLFMNMQCWRPYSSVFAGLSEFSVNVCVHVKSCCNPVSSEANGGWSRRALKGHVDPKGSGCLFNEGKTASRINKRSACRATWLHCILERGKSSAVQNKYANREFYCPFIFLPAELRRITPRLLSWRVWAYKCCERRVELLIKVMKN